MADLLEPSPPEELAVPLPAEENRSNPLTDAAHQKLDELKKQKVEETKAKLKGGIQKLKKPSGSANGSSPATSVGQPTARLGRRAGSEILRDGTKAAGQAIKQVSKQIVEKAAAALARTPIGWIIILIIVVIFLIIGIVLAIFAFSRANGGGPATYPTTNVEKSQAGLLAAFSGDKLKQFTIVEGIVQGEEKRYQKIATLFKTDPGNGPITASLTDVTAVQTGLVSIERLIKAQDKPGTILALKGVIDLEKRVETGLPFGVWVSQLAKDAAAKQTQTVCYTVYTGAAGNVGCASVVSVILNQAGVPQPPVGTTLEVWQNPVYSLVTARPNALSPALAQNALPNLKPGDVVWWGNGSAATYQGALFDHIGIYVGADSSPAGASCTPHCAVNNSSSKEIVRETPLDRVAAHYDNKVFNGAKRYAP